MPFPRLCRRLRFEHVVLESVAWPYRKHIFLASLAALAACGPFAGRLTEASATTYVRSDSDRTTVISPTVHVAGRVQDRVTLNASYGMDAWTGASIDVRTAATQAIHETRHELGAGAGYEQQGATLSASYRYSTEEDYVSHGGVLGATLELAGKDATLALNAIGGLDTVGRAGDPAFEESQSSLGGRAILTQVLGADTLVQLGWEMTGVEGYQAGVYRFVALGGNGTCRSEAPLCIPERVPDERLRNALSARGRRSLGDRISVGLDYRLYFDSWGILSHTIEPDFALHIGEGGTLAIFYRYYTQDDADFYRPRYFDLGGSGGFATRDRKLSAFYTHAAGASYRHEARLDDDAVIVLGARAAVTQLRYLAFVGLSNVIALELTTSAGLEFR